MFVYDRMQLMDDYSQFWKAFYQVFWGKVAIAAILAIGGLGVYIAKAYIDAWWEWIYTRYWKRKGFTRPK